MDVLLIEDDPSAQEIFSEVLGFHGIDLRTVTTQAEAVQAIAQQKPDIVIIDLMLPGADGQTILRTIRPQLPDRPIIATSSYYTSDLRLTISSLGFNDFLPKPIDPSTLVPYLKEIVDTF